MLEMAMAMPDYMKPFEMYTEVSLKMCFNCIHAVINVKKSKNRLIIYLVSLALLNLLIANCSCDNKKESPSPASLRATYLLDQQVSHQIENNTISYCIYNQGDQQVKDIDLYYTNVSDNEDEKRVTLNGQKNGKVPFFSIGAHETTEVYIFKIDFQGTTKAQFVFKLFCANHLVREELYTFITTSTQSSQERPEQAPSNQGEWGAKAISSGQVSDPPPPAHAPNEKPATTTEELPSPLQNPPSQPPEDLKPTPQDQEALLFKFVRTGDIEAVKSLLTGPVNVNCQNIDGETPMHWALYEGQVAIAALLLTKHANIDTVLGNLHTPLFWAITGGNTEVVRWLLDQGGININYRDDRNQTLLYRAAYEGHTEIVALLLARGADPNNSQDITGNTPLHRATQEGHSATVRLLLEKGAHPNAMDKNNRTPLHWAAAQGHLPITTLLLEQGATPDTMDQEGFTPLSIAKKQMKKVDTTKAHYKQIITLIKQKLSHQ
eukprot:gene283-370_t